MDTIKYLNNWVAESKANTNKCFSSKYKQTNFVTIQVARLISVSNNGICMMSWLKKNDQE